MVHVVLWDDRASYSSETVNDNLLRFLSFLGSCALIIQLTPSKLSDTLLKLGEEECGVLEAEFHGAHS